MKKLVRIVNISLYADLTQNIKAIPIKNLNRWMKLIYGRNGVSGMAGNNKMQFTDEQRKAIQLKKRNLLVSASAGTGKTAVLTERIMELLLDSDNRTDIDEMVIVTFTRAAAAEMRGRIEENLNERLSL